MPAVLLRYQQSQTLVAQPGSPWFAAPRLLPTGMVTHSSMAGMSLVVFAVLSFSLRKFS